MGRTLRGYEHIAQKEHTCDLCQRYIQPGDLYRGIVSVNRAKKISVWKEHYHPMCPEEFFEEEEEIARRAEKEADKNERTVESKLRRAA